MSQLHSDALAPVIDWSPKLLAFLSDRGQSTLASEGVEYVTENTTDRGYHSQQHCFAVGWRAANLAVAADLPEEFQVAAAFAGLFHDCAHPRKTDDTENVRVSLGHWEQFHREHQYPLGFNGHLNVSYGIAATCANKITPTGDPVLKLMGDLVCDADLLQTTGEEQEAWHARLRSEGFEPTPWDDSVMVTDYGRKAWVDLESQVIPF